MKFKNPCYFLIINLLFFQYAYAEKNNINDNFEANRLNKFLKVDHLVRNKLANNEVSIINDMYPSVMLSAIINCDVSYAKNSKIIAAFNAKKRSLVYFSLLRSDGEDKIFKIEKSYFKNKSIESFYRDVENLYLKCLSPSEVKKQNAIIGASIGADGNIREDSNFDTVCVTSLDLEGGVGGAFNCYSYDSTKNNFVNVGGWVP